MRDKVQIDRETAELACRLCAQHWPQDPRFGILSNAFRIALDAPQPPAQPDPREAFEVWYNKRAIPIGWPHERGSYQLAHAAFEAGFAAGMGR